MCYTELSLQSLLLGSDPPTVLRTHSGFGLDVNVVLHVAAGLGVCRSCLPHCLLTGGKGRNNTDHEQITRTHLQFFPVQVSHSQHLMVPITMMTFCQYVISAPSTMSNVEQIKAFIWYNTCLLLTCISPPDVTSHIHVVSTHGVNVLKLHKCD